MSSDHGLTPGAYRARWGLRADYPLVAPDYAAKRKELAVKIGLGRKPGTKLAAKRAAKPAAKSKPSRRAKAAAPDDPAQP